MKISTETKSLADIVGFEKALELLAKAGFDAFDFSLFDLGKWDWNTSSQIVEDNFPSFDDLVEKVNNLKAIADKLGLVCNQAHAPFPTFPMLERVKLAIVCAGVMGAKIIVVHPDNNKSAEENAKMYLDLLPLAKKYNLKIATENMWNWKDGRASFAACSTPEDFVAHLNAVNDENFVACLDVGHAEMMGEEVSAVKMIKALNGKLQALHLHDNDKFHDSHQIPFSMNINFEEIATALKEIGYNGYLTLEADTYLKKNAYTAETVFEGVQNLANSARKIGELMK